MPSLVWVDIPCRDLDRAIKFYAAVLGRNIQKTQASPGLTIGLLPHAEGTAGGCLFVEAGHPPSDKGPLIYLNVGRRLEEATGEVDAHGGKTLQPPHPIGPHGWRSVVLDSEGNRIALHSPP